MPVESCVPIIPSADLKKTLRLWVDGLGFSTSREMYDDGRLIGCMLDKGKMWFWLNQRAGDPVKPEEYNGISLYWAPANINRNPGAFEKPRIRGFRARRSGLRADRILPDRR